MIGYNAMQEIKRLLVNGLNGSGSAPSVGGRVFEAPLIDPDRVPCVTVLSSGDQAEKVNNNYRITKPVTICGFFTIEQPEIIETADTQRLFEVWRNAIKSTVLRNFSGRLIEGVEIQYVSSSFFDPEEGANVAKIESLFNLTFIEESPRKPGIV